MSSSSLAKKQRFKNEALNHVHERGVKPGRRCAGVGVRAISFFIRGVPLLQKASTKGCKKLGNFLFKKITPNTQTSKEVPSTLQQENLKCSKINEPRNQRTIKK